jgi:AAA15 family ATPase/GTPase
MWIMSAIMTTEGGVVLVDEIENGLHSGVMGQVWRAIFKACEQNNCQLIATTHSTRFCDEAKAVAYEQNVDEFCVKHLEMRDGSVAVGNVDLDKLKEYF